MFDVKDSLKINNIDMYPYITEAKFGYYKTWGTDTGYTMSNYFVGTFTGTIPKLTLKYAKSLTKQQLQYLDTNILSKPEVTVIFKDLSGTPHTMAMHDGDVVVGYKGLNKHDAFTHEYVGNGAL